MNKRSLIVVSNILGVAVGGAAFYFLFPYIMQAVNWVISIPVLGDILRFGTEHAYIVFPYSGLVNTMLAGYITLLICQPTAKGKKIGAIVLGCLMAVYYVVFTIDLFYRNGFDFVFIVFALVSVGASIFVAALGAYEEL